NGIGSRLAARFERHGGFAVKLSEGALLRHAVLDIAQVPQPDGRAADVLHDDVVEFGHIVHTTHGANAHFGESAHHPAARSLDVLVLQRDPDVLRGEVIPGELVKVQKDVDLPVLAAADIHAAD